MQRVQLGQMNGDWNW